MLPDDSQKCQTIPYIPKRRCPVELVGTLETSRLSAGHWPSRTCLITSQKTGSHLSVCRAPAAPPRSCGDDPTDPETARAAPDTQPPCNSTQTHLHFKHSPQCFPHLPLASQIKTRLLMNIIMWCQWNIVFILYCRRSLNPVGVFWRPHDGSHCPQTNKNNEANTSALEHSLTKKARRTWNLQRTLPKFPHSTENRFVNVRYKLGVRSIGRHGREGSVPNLVDE